MSRSIWPCALVLVILAFTPLSAIELAPGVRGVATRAPAGMKIDGDLSEFRDAFATPVEYFHADIRNRAAQFFYMWDEEAFYAGLRTLDQKQANIAPDNKLWGGDAVEWYFDTRRGDDFRNGKWGKGSVHCYWTGYDKAELKPRFCLRPGYLDAIEKIGVEVGARKTSYGAEVEFKLPWVNFPDFKPELGAVIGLDAELCYSDGGPRIYRTFVYGSPLSVQQPASLARVQLVDRFERAHWKNCGPVVLPMRCDTPWTQPELPHVSAYMALPPNFSDQVGKVVFRLSDLENRYLGEYEATREVLEAEGDFHRVHARWPTELARPGGHQVLAIVYDTEGKELTRVAPRLVSVNWEVGY